ncbi:hypothetical protein QBZ16_003690 [Prototheca wickerhamii]|uniref:Uncharacterized protein n=1 Tax=Prototheca wickerhamii TaxID=3111 RepID=A0AAD9IKG6_PROWI|nr:hypothetical protein QBZ16_003690 [Prototheca wickerhamii]
MTETTSRRCSVSDADDQHNPEQTSSCPPDAAKALRSQLEVLRLEAQRAERACDVALGRELEAREEVVQLRAQVEALESQVEALSRENCETAGDAPACSTAQQPAGGAPQRAEGPRSQLLEAQAEIARLTERLGAAEAARQELESAVSLLRDTASAAEAGAQREARRRQRAEREGKEARASLDARQAELRERKVAALQTSERLERLQGALRAADAAAEQLRRERDLQTEALTRAKREAEAHAAAQGQLKGAAAGPGGGAGGGARRLPGPPDADPQGQQGQGRAAHAAEAETLRRRDGEERVCALEDQVNRLQLQLQEADQARQRAEQQCLVLKGELSAARQHELATQQRLERAAGAEHCRLQEAKALEAELVRCREGVARATAVSKKAELGARLAADTSQRLEAELEVARRDAAAARAEAAQLRSDLAALSASQRLVGNASRERDALRAQTQAHLQKIRQLEDELGVQAAALSRSEAQAQAQAGEIRNLRQQAEDRAEDLAAAKSKAEELQTARLDLQRAITALMQEQAKVASLSDELARPINLHRWRQLKGSDPDVFDLVFKLIAKTEQLAEKDAVIEDKERLCQELRQAHQRNLRSALAAEELSAQQAAVRSRDRQCKALASQLALAQDQVG